MFFFLFLILTSAPARAETDSCPKGYAGISDKFFPEAKEYRRIVFDSEWLGVHNEPGVVYNTEILPGLEANVVKLDNGQSWIIQNRLDLNKSLKPANPDLAMPAGFREPVRIPRKNVYLSDYDFRNALCKAYSQVKKRKDFPELKRLFAKGAAYDDRYLRLELREKILGCLGMPPLAIYLPGNFIFAPISRVTGYLIGGNELASHASNFGYAVPLVAAFNFCLKGILPNYPKTAALLAGSAYVGVNAWEEINFLGDNQIGQRRVGPGESTFDRVRTDWPDFYSGVAGAATMTGIIMMLQSDAYAGFKLAAYCK